MANYNQRPNSRLNKKNRKKKGNTIINILIGVVLLLIIIVVVNIVTDKGPETANVENKTTNNEEVKSEEVDSNTSSNEEKVTNTVEESAEEKEVAKEDQITSDSETTTNQENSQVINEQSDNPNVEETTIDPNWKPIGTTQTGEHVSNYDSQSVDWAEKIQALSYGTGLDSENMYVKFLGNGGSPQKSVGTVTSKDGKEIYRVQLEWIEGQGWKPTKKEKLKSLDGAS
ncbi:DUF1510 family protein [Psychrobacillus sp. NPDC058041]|uniref:YrrS family protein n=1 Tax=Psychrobacillus sp. NPDC058041 TaxID=3346310 RepID=UPI0036D79642